MAKIANHMASLFAIAVFALVPIFSGIVFADDNGMYSHSHITASWNHGLICGDHRCASGETPQPPKTVEPVRAH